MSLWSQDRSAGPRRTLSWRAVVGLAVGAALSVASAGPVLAQDKPAERKAFRVCQDPNNLPFSNVKGEGIENKIAEVFAKELGLPVEYFSFPQRLAFVRNTLRYRLPGEEFRCDIMMGIPVGYDQVSVTKPYNRSTCALVFLKGKGMDQIGSTEDFLKMDSARLKSLRIGVYDRSPGSD